MKRLGISTAVLAFLLLSGVTFVFYGLPHFIRPELIRSQILTPLESWTGGSLTYGRFQFSYFPRFKVAFFDVRFSGRGTRALAAQAAKVEVEPDSFPLLIRKFRVRHLKIQQADVQIQAAAGDPVETLKLKDVNVEALPLGTLKSMRLHAEGGFAGAAGRFSGDLQLSVMSLSSLDWHNTAVRGGVEATTDDTAGVYAGLQAKGPLRVKSGGTLIKIKIEKDKGRDWLTSHGEIRLKQLVYEMPHEGAPLDSLPMDAVLTFQNTFDLAKSEWTLQRSRLELPLGTIEISGHGKTANGEIEELRLSAPALQLEQIPGYFVAARDALPLNIGFSGPGQIEMSLKGTWQQMALYLNADLGTSVITYGQILDKPKNIPLTLAVDAQIHQGQSLSGDLSIRFNEVLAKGTIKNLDFATGQGQINLITNKHPVANWGPVVPALREMKLEGNTKILANWEGDLRNLSKVKKVFNWTLEQAGAGSEGEASIDGLQWDLDYDSGMGLVVKQAEARIGGDRLAGQFSIFNAGPDPVVKVILSSPEIHLAQVLKRLDAFLSRMHAAKGVLGPLLAWSEKFNSQALEGKNFAFEAEMKKGQWHVDKFRLDAEGGQVGARGEIQPGANQPKAYSAQLDIDKAGLSLLFPPQEGKEIVRGRFSASAQFSGNTSDPEKFISESHGEGSLVMTGAEFLTCDLFDALSKIAEFEPLKQAASGKSTFDDIRGHFRLENGKFLTEDLVFLSPDFSVDGKGELSLEGKLNFRLDLYLARDQAAKVIGQNSKVMSRGEGEWFGPVPLLVTGTLAHPEIKADPQLTVKLLNKVQRGDTQGAFRNFLREETLFDKAKTP